MKWRFRLAVAEWFFARAAQYGTRSGTPEGEAIRDAWNTYSIRISIARATGSEVSA